MTTEETELKGVLKLLGVVIVIGIVAIIVLPIYFPMTEETKKQIEYSQCVSVNDIYTAIKTHDECMGFVKNLTSNGWRIVNIDTENDYIYLVHK